MHIRSLLECKFCQTERSRRFDKNVSTSLNVTIYFFTLLNITQTYNFD